MLEVVRSSAIAPLRGRWLVELRETGGRLGRREELPPEAFWSADDLQRLAQDLGDGTGRPRRDAGCPIERGHGQSLGLAVL